LGGLALDDLCQRLGLDPDRLIQEAVASFSRVQSMVAQLKLAMALPQLMEVSIQAALTLEGVKDREIQFMIGGLPPGSRRGFT
jgi:hypothetical protein